MLHERLEAVTQSIKKRSRRTRDAYLHRIDAAGLTGTQRGSLSCGNLAHGFAACGAADKQDLKDNVKANIAIVSAYNDMLSAHQPYETVPRVLKDSISAAGGVAQFAGGVPAMCDGVTQGQPGMELSLFSRDVIAMSTAIALSHNMFDGALLLGICDKIVPGMLIGALSFGHLPVMFVPSGPMPTGLANDEKSRIRQLYAEGKVSRDELLEAESASYHAPGTCTFYGTANSNQMLLEIMGLQLPGASFINPGTPLREQLTCYAGERILQMTRAGNEFTPLGHLLDERAIVNAVVGLLATGGSTNHTIHLVAIAQAAGISLCWDDFASLSEVVPLLTRIYPSGSADVNHFHAAGGMAVLIGELLDSGLLHADVLTCAGPRGLDSYRQEPMLQSQTLSWQAGPEVSRDTQVIASVASPFAADGGIKVLSGNLGRAIIKSSAVATEHQLVEAPAIVFDDQAELMQAFNAGQLEKDFVAVIRYQGPRSNGMPELHNLTPALTLLQNRGLKVAIVTDGRMSGASGKVPAAIHVTPEALDGGLLAKVRTGDVVRLDVAAQQLQLLVTAEEIATRIATTPDLSSNDTGMGRELFSGMRANVGSAESGAVCFAPQTMAVSS